MSKEIFYPGDKAFEFAKDVVFPDVVVEFSEKSVQQTREVYEKMNAAATEGMKGLGNVLEVSRGSFKSFSEKLVANAISNAEATFDAAQEIARAKTVPEAGRLQAKFVQQQFATMNAQAAELFSLSIDAYQSTIEAATNAAEKTLATVKAAA